MEGSQLLTPKEVLEKQNEGAQVIDIRSKEVFSKAYIPYSINIPLSPAFAAWTKRIMSERPALIIVSDLYPIQGVIDALIRAGFLTIIGIFSPFQRWMDEGYQIDEIELLSINNIEHKILIDVRTDDEWNEGHIAHAIHVPVEKFADFKDKISKNREIATICASGNRASIFASLLKQAGYEKVGNVIGGMMAWMECGLPIKK